MRKFIIAAALLAVAFSAYAEVDQAQISVSVPLATTNTGSAVVKGEIYSIRLDCATGKTQAVAIATAEGETLLSISALTADATYYPRFGINKASDGTAVSFIDTTGTNVVYGGPVAVASELTMTVTAAAATTSTNTTRAIITFKK